MIHVRGAYWIVEDTLSGERSHRYDLHWHLPPDAQDLTLVLGGTVDRPGADDRDPRRPLGRARGRLDQPRPTASSTPRRSSARRRSGECASFLTLLTPREPGDPAPAFLRDGDALLIGDDRIVLP